jgi:hypothetical protein
LSAAGYSVRHIKLVKWDDYIYKTRHTDYP